MTTASKRRMAFWGGLGVLAVAALVAALMPTPTPVDQAAVTRGPMQVTLDHEGQTRVRERYVVSAPAPGRLLRIELEPGDPVVAGKTVLATFLPGVPPLLDARTRAAAQARVKAAEAALRQARAERQRARTESQLAATERDRTRRLEAAGLATEQARQGADAQATALAEAVAAADSAVQAAASEVAAARAALIEPGTRAAAPAGGRASLSLRSPIDGVVLRRLRESEADVPQGEPLLEVANLSTLEVMADFLSSDAVRISPGMPAVIDQWGGASPLKGRVRRVEPSGFMKVSALGVEEQRVWVILDFEDPRAAWRSLGDGYRVEARVIVWEQPSVVQTPTASLFRHGQGWAVFVAQDGRAVLRSVDVGHRDGTSAEIRRGLQPGERVVVHPPDNVADGARIEQRTGN
jgi:HlyD family secretion protein